MARTRSINPNAPTDEDVASMTIWARHVWAYLPCHADREGRLKDSAFTLKLAILPSDDVDMDAVLSELATKRHIIRYEVDGRRFIQIRSFKKHQSPHVRETESLIPGVPRDSTTKVVPSTGLVPGQAMASTPIPDPDQVRVRSDPGQCLPALEQPDPDDPPEPGIRGIPETPTDLLRLFELYWVSRWSMPFVRGQWDPKTADAFMTAMPRAARAEVRPAIERYMADDSPKYLGVRHPFQLFARDFDAFRVSTAPRKRSADEVVYAKL